MERGDYRLCYYAGAGNQNKDPRYRQPVVFQKIFARNNFFNVKVFVYDKFNIKLE
jgi:hypothetical protein